MPEEGITRREWDSLVKQLDSLVETSKDQAKTLHSVELAISRLCEREDARMRDIDDAKEKATDALALAQQNRSRIVTLEANLGNNTKALDGWGTNAAKLITGVILLAIGAYIGNLY